MPDPDAKPLTGLIRPDRRALTLEEYQAGGGYAGLRAALKLEPGQVQHQVEKSNLRGRGGAGFFTGKKWGFVPMGQPELGPKYVVCNADEMEPGTMKDRWLLEGNPLQVIEGATIAAYAIEAKAAYIFLRWGYKKAQAAMLRAIAEAYGGRLLGRNILGSSFDLDVHLHVSAGRYMCGEEEGMLNALEGQRAVPRSKPPYAATSGLWGKPTAVNNVETLSCVPHILAHGPQWFLDLSHTSEGGTKIYGASGRVARPGLWELPMGTTVGEILHEHAGGMASGYALRGLLPGGGSTAFLTEKHVNVRMDFASVSTAGSNLGTGTMIVLDDRTCPVSMLISLEQFFARESCGWCTPCREGLPWVLKSLLEIEAGRGCDEDLQVLEEHARLLGPGNTFCALAPGAMMPLGSALQYFRGDIERHLSEHRCPWR
ncbi:MAG: NADH-ubiquinone oxidoreductase-F iron-sulfur binding region domain-containing protein [Planctomycetaceae bacterium]|nr:SLBB domain-containing protein [Planctomycetaceae bacterium]